MSLDSVVSFSSQQVRQNVSAVVEVLAVKRELSQQELQGEAALKLMEAAMVSFDPNVGQNINIYV